MDKALQRLVAEQAVSRVDRGLFYVPRHNSLTKKPTVADYAAVIDAVARRDQARVVVDGLTAANDLGLTTTVPARNWRRITSRSTPRSRNDRGGKIIASSMGPNRRSEQASVRTCRS